MKPLICKTGKKRHEKGGDGRLWCQDCNHYHDKTDLGDSAIERREHDKLMQLVRGVAYGLANGELTAHMGAKILYSLTDTPSPQPMRHHD